MDNNFDINESNELIESETPVKNTDSTESKNSTLDPNGKTEIVGVRFKQSGKTYYFAPNGLKPKQGEAVIVDTSRGQEFGFIALTNRELKNSDLSDPLRCVIRIATEGDKKIHEENAKKQIDAYNACIELIDKHRLEMKLIDTEISFDRSKILFYFSAENRVDFRELVKDLAGAFHTRIEMRQIGIRDEAKILGGLGICGRPYCCNTFLNDFGQVSVKMAKEQNLSLNTAKISGSCGRLMCCLRYEYDTYLAEKALTPKVDLRVMTPSGAGIVTASNPLAGIVKVRLDSLGEDSEPVLFVREDVVDESKYEGQPLTKTEVPTRTKKNDDIPSFAEFSAPSVAFEAPVSQKAEEQPKKSAELIEPSNTEKAAANDGHRHKNRHKKHKNGNAQQGQKEHSQNLPHPQQQQGQSPAVNQAKKKKKKKFFHHHGKNGGSFSSNSPNKQ